MAPGEQAAVHFIDVVGANSPALFLVFGLLAIISVLLIKLMPFYKDIKLKQVEIERESEARKYEQSRHQAAIELENAKIATRQVEAQERSNVIVEALSTNMQVLNAKLTESQSRSRGMGETVNAIDATTKATLSKVDDIHIAILKRD